MPLYEYECQECSVTREVRHSAEEEYAELCPECGGNLKRLFFPAAIHFIGSGWHINDYGGKGDSKDSSAPKSSSTESPKPAKTGSSGESADPKPSEPAGS